MNIQPTHQRREKNKLSTNSLRISLKILFLLSQLAKHCFSLSAAHSGSRSRHCLPFSAIKTAIMHRKISIMIMPCLWLRSEQSQCQPSRNTIQSRLFPKRHLKILFSLLGMPLHYCFALHPLTFSPCNPPSSPSHSYSPSPTISMMGYQQLRYLSTMGKKQSLCHIAPTEC